MIDHVALSFVAAPLVTSAAASLFADRLPPRLGVVGFTAASCLTAVASTVSLAVAGAPALVWAARATSRGALTASTLSAAVAADWLSWLCAFSTVMVLGLFGRGVARQRVALRAAFAQAADLPAGDDVVVIPDSRPDAFALPGAPGRIVVTEGMFAALTVPQQAAVLAHERAHLSLRHHRYAFAVRLASGAQPLLRPVTSVVEYAIERWADERAATTVGDRRSTAHAIGTAALIAQALPGPCVPAVLKAVSVTAPQSRRGRVGGRRTGPLPRRVAALLQPPPAARWRLLLVALPIAAAGASLGLTAEAFFDLSYPAHEPVPGPTPGHLTGGVSRELSMRLSSAVVLQRCRTIS